MVNHKITAPDLPAGIVQRERLYRLLRKCSEKPVIWVSGPGGSGKTTLVSSYVKTCKLSTIWYQLDQRDADPATFFYYMGLAFRDSASPGQEPLPILTPEYLAGIRTFTRHYFDELFRQLPVPYAIVLDDYQEVASHAPFHELILEGLSMIPEGITVIVLSRNEPPPVLSVPDLAGRFGFLGWHELRFSFSEAKEFAGIQTASSLATEALTRLYTKTDGWIAGLLLILESLKKGGALDYQLLERLPLDEVFGYFADKIFDGVDPELQGFLLKTAFVSGITAQFAEQLTGIGSSEQILARLCRNRFFTEKHSPADSVYQYHPLFREFLLSRAELTIPFDELRELRRKAAKLLEGVGRTEDAAALLIEAADWDGLTALVLNSAAIFASEGRSDAVLAWLERIPLELLERVPGLLYWKGVCLLLHAPAQSRNCFQKAFDLHSRANDRVGMLLSWSGGAEVSLYDGEFTPLDHWLSLLEGMHLDDVAFPSQQLEDRMTMSIFNAMAFRQPHHRDISTWRERAVPLVRGSADINFRLQSAVHLIVYDLWIGNFRRATFMLEQTRSMARSRSISPMTEITVMNALVLHAFFTGAWALGVATAADALRIADETGIHVWDSQLLGTAAACALNMGDAVTADGLLQRMESRLEWSGKRIDTGQYHGLRGCQESLRNDFPAAVLHLELSLASFHAIGFPAPEAAALNGMADSLLKMGESARAGEHLLRACQIAGGMGSGYLELMCLFNGVLLALDASDEAQADILLRKAMALGRSGEYLSGWFWRPAALLKLCIKALESDIEVEYVRGLIRRWSLVPETPPLHLDAWPWPLKIRTLGAFTLMRDDEPVVPTGKVKKPLELLKALIAQGGKDVQLERLSDALWPDADGDLAKRSFDTTLHRLRKLLRHEKVLQLQSGRLSIDPRFCWIDIWAFERNCAGIEGALGKGQQEDPGRLAIHFEKGSLLYNGHFLPEDMDQAWTLSMREKMRSRVLMLVRRAAGYYESVQQWEKAATWYRKGLEVDSLAGEFHQRLMVCCRPQGPAARTVDGSV